MSIPVFNIASNYEQIRKMFSTPLKLLSAITIYFLYIFYFFDLGNKFELFVEFLTKFLWSPSSLNNFQSQKMQILNIIYFSCCTIFLANRNSIFFLFSIYRNDILKKNVRVKIKVMSTHWFVLILYESSLSSDRLCCLRFPLFLKNTFS